MGMQRLLAREESWEKRRSADSLYMHLSDTPLTGLVRTCEWTEGGCDKFSEVFCVDDNMALCAAHDRRAHSAILHMHSRGRTRVV